MYKTSCLRFERHIAIAKDNSLKLTKQHHKTTIRENYLIIRAVNTLNSLPEAVVTAPNLNTFKAQLDFFWRELPSIYNPGCFQTY